MLGTREGGELHGPGAYVRISSSPSPTPAVPGSDLAIFSRVPSAKQFPAEQHALLRGRSFRSSLVLRLYLAPKT